MTERFSEFDGRKAGEALGARPHLTRDVAHGDGEALNVGDAVVEVYPDAGVARVTTPDARIELFRVPNYLISGARVVFEQGDEDNRTRLQVRADGKVAFHPVLRAAGSPTTGGTPSAAELGSPPPTTLPETSTARQDATAAAGQESKEPPQVQLVGRLGRDPWF